MATTKNDRPVVKIGMKMGAYQIPSDRGDPVLKRFLLSDGTNAWGVQAIPIDGKNRVFINPIPNESGEHARFYPEDDGTFTLAVPTSAGVVRTHVSRVIKCTIENQGKLDSALTKLVENGTAIVVKTPGRTPQIIAGEDVKTDEDSSMVVEESSGRKGKK